MKKNIFIGEIIILTLLMKVNSLNLSGFLIICATIALLLIFSRSEIKKFLSVKKIKKDELKLALAALFALLFVALITRVLDPKFDEIYGSTFNLKNASAFLIFALTLPIFALKEEFIYRFIQFKLTNRHYPIGIFALAFNFALIHLAYAKFSPHPYIPVFSIFLAFLVLSAFYLKTKNFWLSFAIHLVYNLIIIFQTYLHLINRSAEYVFWLIIISVVLLFTLRNYKSIKELSFPLISKNREKLSLIDYAFLIFLAIIPLGMFLI